MKTIFVVDDNKSNLLTAEEALSEHYDVFTLLSAAFMFELLENVLPDLILLDIVMPEVDGFEALSKLKADARYADIPVIFLSSKSDAATEARGFELGVVDYISKPFSAPVLLNRIKTHLAIEKIIRERTTLLQQRTVMLQHRTEKLSKLQNSMVSILADMVEHRDELTGRHIERTTAYIKILLNAMMERGIYADEIIGWNSETDVSSRNLPSADKIIAAGEAGPQSLEVVASSARLHDIGKIVVTDLILNKPESLTADEYEIMKIHTTEGEKIIDNIMAESGDDFFLQHAKLFAGSHHERWDGTGYPRGLKGTKIPLQGRIMAIADVYDALISDRPYKNAFPHEKALEIIIKNKGSQFDPKLVDVFTEVSGLFAAVSRG
jgi:putative two-component system response regulator